jgi:hypothetical protein
VKNKEKKMFYGGIICLVTAVSIWLFAGNADISGDLIGVQVLKATRAEYIVELKYFPEKTEALQFYQERKVPNYTLIYRYAGDTKDWFHLTGAQVSPAKIKRLAFREDQAKKKTAYDEYRDFFLKFKLIPAYDSKQPDSK